MSKPVALLILDGWGMNDSKEHNAIAAANTPNFDKFFTEYPSTTAEASGMAVGLPDGQMGNSEVGHLNLGAGRVIYQDFTRITRDINNGDFFKKEELVKACQNVKENSSKLHLFGLLSDGGVHSHINHVKGLLEMAKEKGVEEVYLHAFLDGRDTPPRSAIKYIEEIEEKMAELSLGKIATISGRYYAMDRDNRWERIELAYDALVNATGKTAKTAVKAVENSYAEDVADEFVLPTVILNDEKPVAAVGEHDSIIFFNFRPDRARQLTRALVDKDFKGFERNYFETDYVCMTTYDETIENVDVAYKPMEITNTIGEYVAKNGKKQLRMAETEKYAHVTFFFNGGVEEPNENENRVLINSPKVATYDKKPEMSAYEVTDRFLEEVSDEAYDFIVLNFANPDMVGHTGDFDAAVSAVEAVDECLGKVVEKLISLDGSVLITADHGNAELMEDEDGNPMTAHTTSKVPCILVGNGNVKLRNDGKLSDYAPTILELMGLEIPEEMTGNSLIIK